MLRITIQGKEVCIFPGKTADAPAVYLNTFSEEGQQVFEKLRQSRLPDFSLIAVSELDWNRDMVPWDAPSPFKNGEPCTGGADDYLRLLTDTILPEAEKTLAGPPRWRGLAGYSLAGLFALYAICRTDVFSRFASMSGSLWFPGIQEYLASHAFKRTPDCLYLSLGDKESKTRNPLLQTVRDNTEGILAYYKSLGIPTEFQWNPGNHYHQTVERTAAGIAWLLKYQKVQHPGTPACKALNSSKERHSTGTPPTVEYGKPTVG